RDAHGGATRLGRRRGAGSRAELRRVGAGRPTVALGKAPRRASGKVGDPPRLNVAREGKAGRRTRAAAIARALGRTYPDARCALDHESPWQLLVATILSAQCTDAMVNRVTPALFAAYPTPADLAAAPPARVEELIKRTGFFRQKTKSIQKTAHGV